MKNRILLAMRVLFAVLLFAGLSYAQITQVAAESAPLTISTESVDPAAPAGEGWITLSVRGAGPALDGPAHARLFSEPKRPSLPAEAGLHPSTERALGLLRVRRLLRDGGGDLSIHSQDGVGTTFTAWLLRADPTAREPS